MAYDDKLAARVREALSNRRSVTEKKMFGGLAFMLRGHMACGVVAAKRTPAKKRPAKKTAARKKARPR